MLEWLISSIGHLRGEYLGVEEVANRQQQLIVAVLGEVIEMGKRECLEKGLILEMVLEYFTSTLNKYWELFDSLNKEISYEFSHNALKF